MQLRSDQGRYIRWLQAIGNAANVPQAKIDMVKNIMLGAIKGGLAKSPIKGRITLSGYEGSELLVARLLVALGVSPEEHG